jgi:hypothetical protein
MRSCLPSRRTFLGALAMTPAASAQTAEPLRTLRREHPRLIASDADLNRIRALIHSNAGARALHKILAAKADEIESEPPVEYKLIGPRLLDKSRRALDRIYTLALMHRLSTKRRYLDRALSEMRAAAAFPDWNPSHFLDVAEMTHAFAIGYDWLYPALADSDRAWIRKAIVEKGLEPGLEIYRAHRWWTVVSHNWNQVCNGGMTLGALAIADEEPERASEVLRSALESLPRAMASYAPDGGWAEGPGYWDYATRYTTYMLAALDSALGADFGLSNAKGFSDAGRFRIYFTGPTGLSFNYADSHPNVRSSACMFWLARRFSNPVYAWQEQDLLRGGKDGEPLDLVWYRTESTSPQAAAWPLEAYFSGVNVAFLRSAWQDPEATFVAVKGGDNAANHSHLDLGAFVLDANGVRWAVDLGSDDYNLPQYFGKLRWTYYRLRTESHNTVLIDGANQNTKANAPLRAGKNAATIDLADANPDRLAAWTRTVALRGRNVTITDAIAARSEPVEALWGMVTPAEVELQGRAAELRSNGRRLAARIASPEDARFYIVSTRAPEPQNPNEGTRKLVVRLPAKVRATTIEVTLSPLA